MNAALVNFRDINISFQAQTFELKCIPACITSHRIVRFILKRHMTEDKEFHVVFKERDSF